jgi:hypothetical protein
VGGEAKWEGKDSISISFERVKRALRVGNALLGRSHDARREHPRDGELGSDRVEVDVGSEA